MKKFIVSVLVLTLLSTTAVYADSTQTTPPPAAAATINATGGLGATHSTSTQFATIATIPTDFTANIGNLKVAGDYPTFSGISGKTAQDSLNAAVKTYYQGEISTAVKNKSLH